ncbi:unnamed protein product [Rotaria sordida]|uniref:Uncharacterized protein n=1 Tax=Rotaria sordida TaxID=392033 RepID=A0A815WZP9_9BILA|nr:unnamed protein product [Rotaria sordida]
MQIATISYQSNPKENFHNDSRLPFQHRHILTTIKNPQKKQNQHRSVLSNLSINSNNHLPSIKTNQKRSSIKGNGLTSSKLNNISTVSFRQSSCSRSQQSDTNDISRTRSRSITPSGIIRPSSKLIHVKFGYPVTFRSSDFYAPSLSNAELRFREESFVNDSIRFANQNSQLSVSPSYEAFDDPNLRNFFQSSIVLDVVRKTLNIDLHERLSDVKKQSKTIDDYHRIIAKHSSGYGKLNGYDCIPSYSPPRHNRLITYDKNRSSANTSLTSFPTNSSIHFQRKKNSRLNKSKLLTPIATSSPIRHATEATSDIAAASSVSQE